MYNPETNELQVCFRSTGCATCHWTVKTDIFPTIESNTCSVVVGQHEKQEGMGWYTVYFKSLQSITDTYWNRYNV
jgi:hypothetical protein